VSDTDVVQNVFGVELTVLAHSHKVNNQICFVHIMGFRFKKGIFTNSPREKIIIYAIFVFSVI